MISLQPLVRQAAELFEVKEVALYGPSREGRIVRARMAVMAAAHHAGFSYMQIGRALNRDHSTVIHAVERVPYYEKADPLYASRVKHLKSTALGLVTVSGESLILEQTAQQMAIQAVRKLIKMARRHPAAFQQLLGSILSEDLNAKS